MATTPSDPSGAAAGGATPSESWVDVDGNTTSLSSSQETTGADAFGTAGTSKRVGDAQPEERTPPKSPRTAGSENRSPAVENSPEKVEADARTGSPRSHQDSVSMGGEGPHEDRDDSKETRGVHQPWRDKPTELGPAHADVFPRLTDENSGATAGGSLLGGGFLLGECAHGKFWRACTSQARCDVTVVACTSDSSWRKSTQIKARGFCAAHLAEWVVAAQCGTDRNTLGHRYRSVYDAVKVC